MNAGPLHPALVHLPLGLAMAMPLIAFALTAACWRGWLPRRAFVVVAALQSLALLGGFLAARTGEADEDRVERVVAEALIERHEGAASLFLAAAAVAVLLAAAAVAVRAEGVARALMVAATVAAVGVLAAGIHVGKLGGELVYTHNAASAYAGGAAAPGGHRGHDHD